MSVYKIIDTCIETDLNSELKSKWEKYRTKEIFSDISLELSMYPSNYYGLDILNICGMTNAIRNESGILFSNELWTKGKVYANQTEEISSLIMIQLYSYLISKQTILFHSSLVDYQGNGIMFLGPSGIGKTTQAELWNKYYGAEILNGDMVFVKKHEDDFFGYGSPWHGSSPYNENKKVAIKAIVLLAQAPENTLKKLNAFETFQKVMKQIYLPHWQVDLLEKCFETIDQLLENVPVYFLSCRPDLEAVNLVKDELNI